MGITGLPPAGPGATMRRLRTAILFVSLPFGALMFLLPIVGRDMGASAIQIGGLYSIFALMTVFLRPIVGRALDSFGRKPFFLAGIAAYAISNLLYAVSASVVVLYLGRLAQGLGSGLMWLAAYAMVADLAKQHERGGVFGSLDEMSPRGGIIGVAVLLGLISIFSFDVGWRVGFFLFTVVGIGAFVLAWRGIPETWTVEKHARMKGRPSGLPVHWHLRGRLASPPFITLLAIVLLTAIAYAVTSPILIIYLNDHVTNNVVYLALAFLPSALIYGLLPSRLGRLSDRWGRRIPMAVALVAGGIVSISIPQIRSLWPLAALWALEALCFSAATPAEEALVSDFAPLGTRGLAYGLYTAAASLGAVIGPLLGGWLYDALGEAMPFYMNAGILWAAAAGVLFILRAPAQSAHEAEPAGAP